MTAHHLRTSVVSRMLSCRSTMWNEDRTLLAGPRLTYEEIYEEEDHD
jgi:hypothetical protein